MLQLVDQLGDRFCIMKSGHLFNDLILGHFFRTITYKMLTYRRDSAGRQSLRRSRSFKVTDFGTNRGGVPHFNALVLDELQNSGPRNLASRN